MSKTNRKVYENLRTKIEDAIKTAMTAGELPEV